MNGRSPLQLLALGVQLGLQPRQHRVGRGGQARRRLVLVGHNAGIGGAQRLLLSLAWIMRLTEPLFTVMGNEISGRDLILLGGGLFLLWKSVHEIHASLEGGHDAGEGEAKTPAVATFSGVLVQIAIIDIVFSLDSVITAVGLADQISVMVLAILISVGVMMFAAKSIGEFVDRHPTIKMLALSFLVLVGVTLIAEGFETHVPKGYIYFAMAFSVIVEMINIRLRSKMAPKPVVLHKDAP